MSALWSSYAGLTWDRFRPLPEGRSFMLRPSGLFEGPRKAHLWEDGGGIMATSAARSSSSVRGLTGGYAVSTLQALRRVSPAGVGNKGGVG